LPRTGKRCINSWMNKPERIASFLLKRLRKANRLYGLIEDGDRIAVGVSGGKDSQTLLRLLVRWQPCAPIGYDLIAIHLCADSSAAEAPRERLELQKLFLSLEVQHAIRPILLPPDEPHPPDCFRCSWNRRKTLFLTARELGCNKVALGHHADDIAETALLNLFFHGRLESMAPRLEMFQGLITLIRPMALIEEKDIVYYARAAGFWRESICCPYGNQSKRADMKRVLRTVKRVAPHAQHNLLRAVEHASDWGH
jgi:tRNA 2-thiocytidine biosynthesis protein TtcA